MTRPLIVYIPGLLPKPESDVHREALFRCLRHGLQHADPDAAGQVGDQNFELVPWTWDFYAEHRDFRLDAPSVEALLAQTQAGERDIQEAQSWSSRLDLALRRLTNHVPSIVPYLADARARIHIADLKRYQHDVDGAATRVRWMLREVLLAAFEQRRPTLLLAHSMGSVIAWDTLWELSRRDEHPFRLDTLFTMGSPLGQRLVRHHLRGHGLPEPSCWPGNVGRWWNASARGDKTSAIDRLVPVYQGMSELLDEQEDLLIDNWFRLDGEFNPHSEYGYLANDMVGKRVAAWWRDATGS